MKNKVTSFMIFFCLLFFISCSPQKRLERLLKRYPFLKSTELVTFRDTIYYPEIISDTTFSIKFDTIIISNDRLNVQVIRNDSLIYLTATAKGDTVYLEKNIPVEKIVYTQAPKKGLSDTTYIIIISVLLTILGFVILAYIIKR